ncbi:hypothetical protein [Microtetraspora fusca]|uniref:hypothetical protein n=1 Tax=Microtetraspora fusca TaxID=1997 RepID=UPI0008308FDA|nr:hypothetical protein [Microtetraspora fusca]
MPILAEPVDLVVEGYSSDTEIENLDAYRAELRETLHLRPEAPIVLVSHHLSHPYSAFPPSPVERAAGLVVDAQGSRVRDLTEEVDLPPGAGGHMLEVASFYRCERGRIECLAKQPLGRRLGPPGGPGLLLRAWAARCTG